MTTSIKPGLPHALESGLALWALAVVSPVVLGSMLAVKLTSPGPALFKQARVGQGGRTFTLVKLRTMRMDNAGIGVTAKGDARITPVGRVLRKSKLDELPELWNVVVGDLSLVGPRPEVPRYVDFDNPLWTRVLQARPGLTDPVTLRLRNEEELLASVDGDRERFYIDVLQRFKLKGYLRYLQERSWHSDLRVLAQTALAIVSPGRAPPPNLDEVRAVADNDDT